MFDLIGGRQYVLKLLKVLENLFAIDEVQVRNEAVKSYAIICDHVNFADIEREVLEVVKTLSAAQFSSQKISSVQLIKYVMPKCSSTNKVSLIK